MIKTTGCCYVYVQGNERDIEKFYELVSLSKNDEIILYPERAFTFVDCVCYRPYVKTVVTENPYIISCYSRKDVYVLQDGEWVHPDDQTYGTSINYLTTLLLNYDGSIPLLPLGGIKEIEEYREKVKTQNFG